MNHLSRREFYFLIITIVFGFIVLITYLIFTFFRSKPPTVEIEAPSAIPYSSANPIPEPSIRPLPTPSPIIIDYDKIDALKRKLPYNGEYIMLKYDPTNNIFIYVYHKNLREESRTELQQFLEKNGFSDRGMLDTFGMHEYFY